jgi:hypothetical protein
MSSRLPVLQLETEATGADLLPIAPDKQAASAAHLADNSDNNEEHEYVCDGKST